MPKWLQQINIKARAGLKNTALRIFLVASLLVTPLSLVAVLVIIGMTYRGSVYPNIYIAGHDFGGLKIYEARAKFEMSAKDFSDNSQLEIVLPDDVVDATASAALNYATDWNQIELEYDINQTIDTIYSIGRSGRLLSDVTTIFKTWRQGLEIKPIYQFNQDKFVDLVKAPKSSIKNAGKKAYATLSSSNPPQINIFAGEDGYVFDSSLAVEHLTNILNSLDPKPVNLVVSRTVFQLTPEQHNLTELRAEKLATKSLSLIVESDLDKYTYTHNLSAEQLVSLIDPYGGFQPSLINQIVETIKTQVNRSAENAELVIENNKATKFNPGKTGLSLSEESVTRTIIGSLYQLEADRFEGPVSLSVIQTQPELTLADTNNLGIAQLLGRGESFYRGSIAGRVHNVAHTAKLINGHIIAPGEEFSFNQAVGPINRSTGFQSAYVIKDGRTVLGDGGGVCQDSTTLFRAIMDAGLEITQRRPHSYRVGYYEQGSQPGFDATVYAPSVDLKFRNDTSHHILIVAQADSANLHLVVDIYGTSDGRVSEIVNYRQWDSRPAPAPLYQDDPSLPVGTVKQVDWAAAGLRTAFDYVVTKDGQELHKETFTSNYRPWQAVYLVGTKTD